MASKTDKKLVAEYEKRVVDYVNLRNTVRGNTPKVAKDATPAQVEAYQTALQKAVRDSRASAKRGDIFVLEVQPILRRIIRDQFTDFEKSELRKTVLEAETSGVTLAVNAVYPESKELVQMPPPLLLALPQLPQELRYRFVGRSMILLDKDGSLILDILPDALP